MHSLSLWFVCRHYLVPFVKWQVSSLMDTSHFSIPPPPTHFFFSQGMKGLYVLCGLKRIPNIFQKPIISRHVVLCSGPKMYLVEDGEQNGTFITSLWCVSRSGGSVNILLEHHFLGHEASREDAWSHINKLESTMSFFICSLFHQLTIERSCSRLYAENLLLLRWTFPSLLSWQHFLGSHFFLGLHSARFCVTRQSCQLIES